MRAAASTSVVRVGPLQQIHSACSASASHGWVGVVGPTTTRGGGGGSGSGSGRGGPRWIPRSEHSEASSSVTTTMTSRGRPGRARCCVGLMIFFRRDFFFAAMIFLPCARWSAQHRPARGRPVLYEDDEALRSTRVWNLVSPPGAVPSWRARLSSWFPGYLFLNILLLLFKNVFEMSFNVFSLFVD